MEAANLCYHEVAGATCFQGPVTLRWDKWKWSRSVVSDSLRPSGLWSTRLLRPWDFPSKSTGVGCQIAAYLINYLKASVPTLAWTFMNFFFRWHPRSRRKSLLFPSTISHIYSCSVTHPHLTLCDSMDCSMPGFPIHYQFLEPVHSSPLSQWHHPTISSSVVPFSFCLQSCPASGSFLMSQLFTSGSQSVGASASASVLPMNIQGWFTLGLNGLISLFSKGLSSLLQHHGSRWYGEGGGRGVQNWELMYTSGGFMSIYGKTNTVLWNKVKIKIFWINK